MEKQIVLVVDYGTSNVRVNAVDTENGSIVCSASKKYLIHSPRKGYAEISVDELWSFSEECMTRVVEEIKGTAEPCAIAFSFFGDNLIPVDRNGNALNDCILCTDIRGAEEAEYICNMIPEKEQIEIIGDSYMLYKFGTKVLWVKRHLKEFSEKIAGYDSQQQYVFRKLGLRAVNDYTMAARKQLCCLQPQRWSDRFMDVLEITPESLGEIIGTGDIVGAIRTYGSVSFDREIPVIAGGHDCDVALIGMGIIDEKQPLVGDITGTFDHVGYLAEGHVNLKQEKPEFPLVSYNGPISRTTVCLGAFPTAGATLEWFMREIEGGTSAANYDSYWNAIQFNGQGSVMVIPTLDNDRGVIEGIGVNTKKADIFKAVIEALTFENRRLVENCSAVKRGNIECIRIGGGAANSSEWMQLRADISGMPIERMENIQISSLGSAALAAVAVGVYPDLETAVAQMVHVGDRFIPDTEVREKYELKYQKYIEKQNSVYGKEQER